MKYPFERVYPDNVYRPMIPFRVEGMPVGQTFWGLVDSGAMATTLDARIADALRIPLIDSAAVSVAIGGSHFETYLADVGIIVGQHRWVSEVRFARGWSHSYYVFGLQDLFSLFRIHVDASSGMTDLAPHRHEARITRVRR